MLLGNSHKNRWEVVKIRAQYQMEAVSGIDWITYNFYIFAIFGC